MFVLHWSFFFFFCTGFFNWDFRPFDFYKISPFSLAERKQYTHLEYSFKHLFYYTSSTSVCRFQLKCISFKALFFLLYWAKNNIHFTPLQPVLFLSIYWRFLRRHLFVCLPGLCVIFIPTNVVYGVMKMIQNALFWEFWSWLGPVFRFLLSVSGQPATLWS